MESKQSTQMVAWLDEERRKDKALIVKLEERVSTQNALVEDMSRRMQGLETDLASLRSMAISTSLFDESITRIRTELSAAIDQLERKSGDTEMKRIRDLIRDGTSKALEDLRQEVLTRIERELQPRRAEEERLSRVALELQNYADTLGKSMDESQRSLTYLEEQRRQDSKRLSDIHSEASESSKHLEGVQAKSELLEDLSRRNERGLAELAATVTEMQQQKQVSQEQDALAQQEREKLLGDTLRRIEETMTDYSKQFEGWSEYARTMKKQVQEFERTADRVERRFNEVAEMQRLSEERFRHEWDDFQQDDQKRFRQFTLTNEEAWRENNRLTKTIVEDIAQVTETTTSLVEQFTSHSSAQTDTIASLIASLQNLIGQTDGQPRAKKR
jgi:chromosome segregation ATPase